MSELRPEGVVSSMAETTPHSEAQEPDRTNQGT